MLQPARSKFRKQQKGRLKGVAHVGCNLAFGDFGLQAMSTGFITSRQIESARIAISRHLKKGGKMWIRIFPDKPVTKKPLEVRMGKGKGAVEGWVAPIQRGRILYELEGVDAVTAKEAFTRASHKLPLKTKLISREDYREAC